MVLARVKELFNLFAVVNTANKMRLLFYYMLSVVYRITKQRLLKTIIITIFNIQYEVTVAYGELHTIFHTNVLKEYMQLKEFIPTEDAICIDVGANIGSTALSWTHTLKKGKIYAIEPHPKTYLSLIRNIKLNEMEKIIIPRQLAIGVKSGEEVLFISDRGSMARKPGNYKWRRENIIVDAMTLDRFIKKEKITNIDILKVDVEGFEKEVLEGAKNALKITDHIVLEVHSPMLRESCEKIIADNGFEITEIGSLIFGRKNYL